MKVLLDTHILLWALTNDERLPLVAKNIILQKENEIFYSTASVWETMIKYLKHPEHMPISGIQLSEYCQRSGYSMLPISDKHVFMLEGLQRVEDSPKHSDPFDRLMIAQAKEEGMVFVTHDSLIPDYDEACILFV